MPAAIETHGLGRLYPAGGGVQAISFRAEPGEVVGVVGPAGSGKSTLLNLLATRIRATHGAFSLAGLRIAPDTRDRASLTPVRRRIGALLEDCPVVGDLTGWENAWLLARLHGVPGREARRRLNLLFSWAAMAEVARRTGRTYTYPMRKKLGIIGALVHSPDLLLLDEPCNGLQSQDRMALQQLLGELRRTGVTVILATTEVQEVRLLCTRALLLERGALIHDGPAADLTRSPWGCSRIEVRLDCTPADLDLSALPALRFPPELEGNRLRLRVDDPEAALPPLISALARSGVRISAVEVQRP